MCFVSTMSCASSIDADGVSWERVELGIRPVGTGRKVEHCEAYCFPGRMDRNPHSNRRDFEAGSMFVSIVDADGFVEMAGAMVVTAAAAAAAVVVAVAAPEVEVVMAAERWEYGSKKLGRGRDGTVVAAMGAAAMADMTVLV